MIASGTSETTRFVYAGLVGGSGSPVGPLGIGLLMIGFAMVPISDRKRRIALMMVIAALGLGAAVAGCSGGTSGAGIPTTTTQTVNSDGSLSAPITLSAITDTGNSTSTTQSLAGIQFGH